MSGGGLWAFLITCVELFFIGAIIFLGIDFVVIANAQFKQIAKYAVGGVLIILFLIAVGAVLGFGGGGGLSLTPLALIYLAVTIIVLFVVIYIVNIVVSRFAPEPAKEVILLVVGAVAVIVMLLVAADALTGGGVRSGFRHAAIDGPAVAAGAIPAWSLPDHARA